MYWKTSGEKYYGEWKDNKVILFFFKYIKNFNE